MKNLKSKSNAKIYKFMEIKAQLNYLRMSPRKVRLVANLVKGMDVRRAEIELSHLPKRASIFLLKLLRSAVSNAKHNFQLDDRDLYIRSILVNEGPTLKRYRPRAFGRLALIRKRTSHVILNLGTRKNLLVGKFEKKDKEPTVRAVIPEEVKEVTPDIREERRALRVEKPKRRAADFVRRVFRRKAI